MKKRMSKIALTAGCMAMVLASLSGCSQQKVDENAKAFTPSLDTEKSVSLEISGFMGNFEALDQVVNSFNEYYPNVTISYEQNNWAQLAEYMQNNDYIDIFMTDDLNVRYSDWTDQYVGEHCVDVSKENIDFSAIDDKLLDYCKVDGQLVRVPLSQKLYGMVVNKTLLEKEGLQIPTNYGELLDVCEALKKKGYTPIQGSNDLMYNEIMEGMTMNLLSENPDAVKKFNEGDGSEAEILRPVVKRLQEMLDKGYIDTKVNETYPNDNYDGAILNFFEGDVPFWVCNTECVSGMKKRESKSETFSANPFEYTFVYAPMGDKGAYEYHEPWYGFSVNRDSDEKDYAIEFIRFLMMEDQINQMASVKGMSSVAKNSSNDLYKDIQNPGNIESCFVNDGTVESGVQKNIGYKLNDLGKGNLSSVDETVQAINEICSWKE